MLKRCSILALVLLFLMTLVPFGFAAGGTEGTAAKAPVTIKLVLPHIGIPYLKDRDMSNDPYAKELSRLSGYNLVYEIGPFPDTEYNQYLALRFASGDLPDIIRSPEVDSPTAHPGALDNGALTEMGPLIDKYGPAIKKNIPSLLWQTPKVAKNGKIWGIPSFGPHANGRVVYVRQDWLDKSGIGTLKTTDDFLKFYEWVKVSDPNGNGVRDDYGFYATADNTGYWEMFFECFGAYPTGWTYRDGSFVPDMILPEMKDAIRFWTTLYAKGYVNPDLFTNNGNDWGAGIWAGKAATFLHDVANYHYSWTDQMVDKSARLSMIAAPLGPKGNKLLPAGDSYYYVNVFPKQSKVVDDAVKFINWCWSSTAAQTFFNWGIEGKNYTVENGKIKWDPEGEHNKPLLEWGVYRVTMNPTAYAIDTPKQLAEQSDGKIFIDAYKVSDANAYVNPAMYMPPLDVFKTAPELNPGVTKGTLFLEMFAKVITGKEQLDPAFNTFVAAWKQRGGNDAIKQATAWYSKNHK